MNLRRLSKVICVVIGAMIFAILFSASTGESAHTATHFSSKELDSHTVTLITGDKINIHTHPSGRKSIDIEPADRDGYKPSFEKKESSEDVYVIPDDIGPFLHDQLDIELFNVTQLVNQ